MDDEKQRGRALTQFAQVSKEAREELVAQIRAAAKQGWTHEQIARYVGFERSWVTRVINGKR